MARTSLARTLLAGDNSLVFLELCAKLERNDRNLTTVSTARTQTPNGYGIHLGKAIRNNSVVSEIQINLVHFLSRANRSIRGAYPLLHWLQHNPALQTVKFCQCTCCYGGNPIKPLELILLERMLSAMAKNPAICSLESNMPDFPLPLLTTFLKTRAAPLQSLMLEKDYKGSDSDLQTLAQAIVEHNLESLGLCVGWLNMFSAGLPTLRHLSICADCIFGHSTLPSPQIAALITVLSNCPNLSKVSIHSISFLYESWSQVVRGLQANPSITALCLQCEFTKAAGFQMLKDMRSLLPHTRHLDLSKCTFYGDWSSSPPCGVKVANMVCGSALRHVTVDETLLDGPNQLKRFFRILHKNNSTVQLRSIRVNTMHWNVLSLVSEYLEGTVVLRRATFSHVPAGRSPGLSIVPVKFLRSLRQNGSLHSVEILDESLNKQTEVMRYIEAVATRNRLVPHLLVTALDGSSRARDDRVPAAVSLFPILCEAAMQATRMAPNTLLASLLTGADTLASGPTRRRSKRLADQTRTTQCSPLK